MSTRLHIPIWGSTLLALSALASPRLAAAGEAEWAEFRRNTVTEERMLNRPLESRLLAGALGVWDSQAARWMPLSVPQPVSAKARVIVLNLFAHYCKPCARELPVMLDVLKSASQGREHEVQTFLLAEDTTAADMQRFLAQNAHLKPEGYYFDNGGAIRRALTAGSQLPVTILLDRDLVVRYAIVGAIESRVADLKEQVSLLLSAQRR